MAEKTPLFTINTSRNRLSFYANRVVCLAYCGICKNWDCVRYVILKSEIAELLRTRVGIQIELRRSGFDASHRPNGDFRIGCKTFRLSPINMRKVRRWALK